MKNNQTYSRTSPKSGRRATLSLMVSTLEKTIKVL